MNVQSPDIQGSRETVIPPQFEAQDQHAATIGERLRRSWLARTAMSLATATGLITAASAVEAQTAYADTGHVYVTTDDVWLHADPGLGDRGDLIKIMPKGTQFTADCYVNDTPIGPLNNPAWLHGTDETGATGYFTDYYSSSHWSGNNTLHDQGLPFCGEQSSQDPPKEEPAPKQPNNTITSVPYDRGAAANWALANAEDTPPYDASCTWFVSNALWKGGLPKSALWNDEGEHGRILKRPGTVDAWQTDSFIGYIRHSFPQSSYEKLDITKNQVPKAQIGDVIAYDFDADGYVDHISLVTDIADPQYPEVSEWSPLENGRLPSPYVKRGWTWSEATHQWLQAKTHGKVVVSLLHINTEMTGTY